MIERFRFGLMILFAACFAAAPAGAAGSWEWPVSGDVITAYKNGSDPYAAGQHRGIDIAAPVGTAVHSSVAGSVTYSGHLPDGGITVTVTSADGRYLVSYLHLSELAVKKGDSVAAGKTVGSVGTTGKRSASVPHLHLGVRLAGSGEYIDPLPLLGPRPTAPSPAADAPAISKPVDNVAPHANAKAQARTRVRARTPKRSVTERRVPERATSRGARPNTVHVPSSGDGVSAHRQHAADSARESHASQSSGRVAPPPFKVAQAQPANLATPGRTRLTTGDVQNNAAQAPRAESPPYVLAAILLTLAAVAALLLRRRRGSCSDFTPPLAHRDDLRPRRHADDAEVVELRAASRRA